DAAGDGDNHAAAFAGRGDLQRAHAAELGKNLFRCLLADVAGVEDDEVGVVGAGGLGKTFRCERVRHTMGIVDVHLAAERFDMDLAHSSHALNLVTLPSLSSRTARKVRSGSNFSTARAERWVPALASLGRDDSRNYKGWS